MTTPAPGRLYQDNNFVVTELNGLALEQLIVCENPETKEPLIIYIKARTLGWHQFFIDAGMGFWENWNTLDDQDDGYSYIDKTQTFSLLNKQIKKIYCTSQENSCTITIEFETHEQLMLHAPDMNHPCEFVFVTSQS